MTSPTLAHGVTFVRGGASAEQASHDWCGPGALWKKVRARCDELMPGEFDPGVNAVHTPRMGRLGDMPTRRIDAGELAKFARTSDDRERAKPEPRAVRHSSAPEIEIVDGELTEAALGIDPELLLEDEAPEARVAPTAPSPRGGAGSGTRPAVHAAVGDWFERVPVVIASREKLSRFELGESARLLMQIDGQATVLEVILRAGFGRDHGAALLRYLETRDLILIERV